MGSVYRSFGVPGLLFYLPILRWHFGIFTLSDRIPFIRNIFCVKLQLKS